MRQTRRAIADAALRLFAERGYEETTIADIAGAADVSPRTFFSYLPSKEDVVFAEINERLAEVREGLDHRPSEETPLESLRRIVLEMIEAIAAVSAARREHVSDLRRTDSRGPNTPALPVGSPLL